jgi:WD40 repeat protein
MWSPDGRYIASSGLDLRIHVWEAATGKNSAIYSDRPASLPLVGPILVDVCALAWSPDSARIASAYSPELGQQTVDIWSAISGKILRKCSGPAEKNRWIPFSLAWSPDGRFIAAGGSDEQRKKWKLDLTATDYQSIQLWDADTGRLLRTFGAAPWSNQVAWSPDGRYIASAEPNHVVNIWEAATGQRVGRYAGHTEAVRTVAWSPDGSMIASGGNDCTVHLWIWNPRTHIADLSFVYRGHTHTVLTLAWSPEGACIASAGADKTVQVWRVPLQ